MQPDPTDRGHRSWPLWLAVACYGSVAGSLIMVVLAVLGVTVLAGLPAVLATVIEMTVGAVLVVGAGVVAGWWVARRM